jgi:hypothetical protein
MWLSISYLFIKIKSIQKIFLIEIKSNDSNK